MTCGRTFAATNFVHDAFGKRTSDGVQQQRNAAEPLSGANQAR